MWGLTTCDTRAQQLPVALHVQCPQPWLPVQPGLCGRLEETVRRSCLGPSVSRCHVAEVAGGMWLSDRYDSIQVILSRVLTVTSCFTSSPPSHLGPAEVKDGSLNPQEPHSISKNAHSTSSYSRTSATRSAWPRAASLWPGGSGCPSRAPPASGCPLAPGNPARTAC